MQMTCRWSVGRRLSDVPLWVNIVPPVPKFADTMHLIGFNFHLIGYELVECLFVKSFDGLKTSQASLGKLPAKFSRLACEV